MGQKGQQNELANDNERIHKSPNIAQQVQQTVSLSIDLNQIFIQVYLEAGKFITRERVFFRWKFVPSAALGLNTVNIAIE